MASLEKQCFLIAGSISKSTDRAQVERAHQLARGLTKSALAEKASLVVYLSGEPKNEHGDSMVFDWTVAREVEQLSAQLDVKGRLHIVTSQRSLYSKMDVEGRELVSRLVGQDIARIEYVDDDVVTGGNIRDAQLELATAMIAISGGKGVLDRAQRALKLKLPVFPFDIDVGAFCDDGPGAPQLNRQFTQNPALYMPHTGESVRRKMLGLSAQHTLGDLQPLADKTIQLFVDEFAAKDAATTPDVLVLTALPVELAAAKHALGIDEDDYGFQSEHGIHVWRVKVEGRNGPLTCVVASFNGAGNSQASAVTSMLISELRPHAVFMMGIAAGMRSKLKLGDVILSERVVAYEGAAALSGGVMVARPDMSKPEFRTQQDMGAYLAQGSRLARLARHAESVGLVFPPSSPAGDVSVALNPTLTTIAAGEKLVRDEQLFKKMQELHGKVCVAEMEAHGVFEACSRHEVPALVIRGISDHGDHLKDDALHEVASLAAAVVTADYIAHGLILHRK
ncbi:purine phosphorylase [Pseudomonas sp. TNT2022 ID357]|uniref:Purine phosphorylase n=1 Tax=Pseudomonas idahonensis TaxID=2942628 RepID=A0ABT5Q8C7_9PSED|nr:5'-methylthioadenosine/S-adenosylhomocysteine nucleosidase [Pseudomonas idahonensis]MDD1150249.1 purine phosphorylase [Pseudomonas idahonensis]